MTTIRPTGLPPTPAPTPQPRSDAGRLAAQKAFFDMIAGKAAPAAAAQTVAAEPASAASRAQRTAPAAAEPPAKILRPGSLLDIRV